MPSLRRVKGNFAAPWTLQVLDLGEGARLRRRAEAPIAAIPPFASDAISAADVTLPPSDHAPAPATQRTFTSPGPWLVGS